MNDILTKEERETVERAKALLAEKWSYGVGEWVGVAEILMDIIDNLSKRGVKKYSEEEVETLALKYYMIPPAVNEYTETEALKIGAWHDCVSTLGALEEK